MREKKKLAGGHIWNEIMIKKKKRKEKKGKERSACSDIDGLAKRRKFKN